MNILFNWLLYFLHHYLYLHFEKFITFTIRFASQWHTIQPVSQLQLGLRGTHLAV